MVADNPDQFIELKMFHVCIRQDHAAMGREEAAFKPIPQVIRVTEEDVPDNYIRIKVDIEHLIRSEIHLVEANEVLVDNKPPATDPDDDRGQAPSINKPPATDPDDDRGQAPSM